MLVDFKLTSESVSIPKLKKKEMLSVVTDGAKTLVRINSSSLGILQECQRKAKYSLKDQWSSNTENPATLFGSAIHKALEVFYSGNPEERKLPELEQLELMSYGNKVNDEETDLCLRATRAFVTKASPLAALPQEDKRSIQNGVYILWNYFKTYLNDPYVAYIDDKGPFVEREFSFKLYESKLLDVEYFGTIDLVVKDIKTGDIMVCDHKTSSVVGNDFYNRLKPNHQYTGYLLGAKKVFGVQSNSFLVNCIQVKEKPKTSRGTAPHFPRQITTRDEDDFREFKESVLSAVSLYLENEVSQQWPLGHTNACAAYGGCQYLSICMAPKSMRENMLAAKFNRQEMK